MLSIWCIHLLSFRVYAVLCTAFFPKLKQITSALSKFVRLYLIEHYCGYYACFVRLVGQSLQPAVENMDNLSNVMIFLKLSKK